MIGVKYLVAVHHCHEVFGVGEVDDVVGVAGQHDDRLDFISAHLVFNHLIRPLLAHLDQAVALHHDELFPLAVVPVLALGYTRLGDVDANLPAVGRVDQFGERAAVVAVHFQVKNGLVLGQIAQVG